MTTIADTPPPTWTPVGGRWLMMPPGVPLAAALPAVDVVVAGYWEMLASAALLPTAPVVHFEQGDFHLYEDLPPHVERMVRQSLKSTPHHMTVSGQTARVLEDRYSVKAAVLHNAVDGTIFRHDGPVERGGAFRLICVGSDANAFKGIDDVMTAWSLLRDRGLDVEMTWVTPRPPVRGVDGVRVVVAPDQLRLAQEYRSADVYVSASHYESFPLPPLEAMACGTVVVSTANVGVQEYARRDENALLVPLRDPAGLAEATARVLHDTDLRQRLEREGLRTAASFDWETIMDRLEGLLRSAKQRLPPAGSRVSHLPNRWRIDLQGALFDDDDGDERFTALLSRTQADAIVVPLRQPAIEHHDIVRWRTVAWRRNARAGGPGHVRAWLPMTSDQPVIDHDFQEAIDALRTEQPSEAVRSLLAELPTRPKHDSTLSRWLVLALLENGEDSRASQVLQEALRGHPEHPDFYYLAVLVAGLAGVAVDVATARAVVHTLRAGATAPEWFAKPDALLEQRI